MTKKHGIKAALIGAALAGLWGTAALANSSDCISEGTGGSGQSGADVQASDKGCVPEGTGGSGIEGTEPQGMEQQPSTAPEIGSEQQQPQSSQVYGGAGDTNINVMPVTPVEEMTPKEQRRHSAAQDIKRYPVGVRVGGGAEGVAADLNKKLTGGPTWNATLSAQPLSWMGAEIAYNGATHEVDNEVAGTNQVTGAVNGADFVSNGGQAALTFNLPTPVIQPYAMGGIGFDRWEYRGADNSLFHDDTAGRVPFGGGLKANSGQLSADLRFNYNVLFSQNFARTAAETDGPGSSYDLALQVGARF